MRTSHVRLIAVVLVTLGFCAASPWCHAQDWTAERGAFLETVEMGRERLLRNVHGYNDRGVVVAPVRGIAYALGATVQWVSPEVVLKRGDDVVRLRVGETWLSTEHSTWWMDRALHNYGGVVCAPLRDVAKAFGVETAYCRESIIWDHIPYVVVLSSVGNSFILVHHQPPDAVAKVIADLQEGTLVELADPEITYSLECYGQDWVVQVTRLASDGKHFTSGCPATWCEEEWIESVTGRPCFSTNAAAVYGLRNGKWRLLVGMQDMISYEICDKVGLPYDVARELDVGPMHYGVPAASPTVDAPLPAATVEPPIQSFLTPQNAHSLTYIGSGYFVSSLNFRRQFEFAERGVKVLGLLSIPPFEPTSKPVTVQLTLSAFGVGGGMLGSSTISLTSIPSDGAIVPFQTGLLDVGLDELGYVTIIPKGAWTHK